MKTSENIAILGYGLEGKAVHEYLKKHGYNNIVICDEKEDPTAFDHLGSADHIFRSPGVPLSNPKLQAHKAKITSATRYFFDKCPCPIIGVTGTKGKGTTSTLIQLMLRAAGKDAYLGGNIGNPAVSFLDQLTPESIAVLELSSFQLQDLTKSPHIAVVLNTTQDHLDVHADVKEYHEAKRSIATHQTPQDHLIYNADYPGSAAFKAIGEGQKHPYSTKEIPEVIRTAEIALRGPHNIENILPATQVAKLLGVPDQAIQKTLQQFTGLPHRLELVAERDGIKYFDDSFSTNPETSIAGIRSFTEPLWLIAGGSEKHSDFAEWGKACGQAKNLKAVLLIGQMAERMATALDGQAEFVHTKDLANTFAYIKDHAKPGDFVLLSPAAASFDQFQNYKARGDAFKKMAQ